MGGRRRRPRSASWAVVDRGGGVGHRVDARLGLREGDDLADVLLAGEDRHQAVDAEGEAAVGRGAVAERREEEPEAALRLLLADAEQVEDPLLQRRARGSGSSRSRAPSR